MIISLNWLKKYTDIDIPVDKLAAIIGERLVEIEKVIDLGTKYENVLIVKVVEANPIEGSDHLNLTKIDDGGVVKDIERDNNNLIQVVCGAPNVREGQLVVWLPPKSTVPSTYNSKDPFVLGSRELRGHMSNGMIASAKELDLFDEHEGILEVDKELPVGTLFADAYELDDYLLDIENKSLTHRPDCFSIIGFAREVAAICGKQFKTPDWLLNTDPDFDSVKSDEVNLDVSIDDSKLSSRYLAIVMSEADGVKKSPLQIQTYLSRVGVRPINAVVDVTNYLMMLTGQPLHAFDYDKLVAVGGGKADIHVRAGLSGEKLELLDGRIIELSTDDIIIAAGQTAIGLAGAMGGANTAIDGNTKNIIIESATFDLYNLRATQMRHGIFSEAITRFTKGQPAELSAPVLFDAVRLMNEWAGARCISSLAESYPEKQKQIKIGFVSDSVNKILGCKYSNEEIIKSLNNAEILTNTTDKGSLLTIVPYWRSDIRIIEDISEEVGRLNGYENINISLPSRYFESVTTNDFDEFRNKIRKILTAAGANEVLSYSFIHGDVIEKSKQDLKNSYRVVNSISPDLQYYRQSLTPSLLDFVHPNIKQSFDNFILFEINKSHSKANGVNEEKVPIESEQLALVYANKDKTSVASYYQAKNIVDYLCKKLGIDLSFMQLDDEKSEPEYKPFEYKRSAIIIDKNSGKKIGIVGEYKKSVMRAFKLPENVSGFEINTLSLFDATYKLGKTYRSLSRFPSSERDVCFRVHDSMFFSELQGALELALEPIPLETNTQPIDIYQVDGSDTKNITFRIKITSHDHTLTSEEVNSVMNSAISVVVEKTKATVV